jgi:hypothetical protein
MMQPVPSAGAGFSPLDVELGLVPNHRFTPRVEEVVARAGASLPFAEAAALLHGVVGVQVSEATPRRLTYAAGSAAVAVEETARARIEPQVPPVADAPARMQISLDATKVPLVGGEWTDAKLGVIAALVPAVDAEGQPTVEAVNLSYTARWEPAETFGRTLTLEAHRRGVEGARDLASPNDGAEWIQGVLDYMAPHAVRILDVPHAAEHLGAIALLVYGERTPAATAWVATQRQRLREEDPAPLLVALEQALADGPRSGSLAGPDGLTPQEWLAREVAFFQKRADQIRYAAFRQARYPIGSGIVESGHKVIISPRFKRAGQHWAPAHLNPLLVLRTTICNDRWVESWPLIWAQQQAATVGARQAARQQRRLAPSAEAPSVPSPVPEAVPAPSLPERAPAAARVRTCSRAATARRRPAPDHPWRRPFLPDRRAG